MRALLGGPEAWEMTPRPGDPGERPAGGDAHPDPSPIARALTGFGVIAFGVVMLAAGLSWIPLQPSPGVPHWLVGLIGAICVLAGTMAFLPPGSSRLTDMLAAILFTAFAVVPLWIGFGPGKRHFSGGISLGPIGIGISGETIGRSAFGPAGLLLALVAAVVWSRVFRERVRS